MWDQHNYLKSFLNNLDLRYFEKNIYSKSLFTFDTELHALYSSPLDKAIGVLTNRTWNMFTSGIGGDCIDIHSFETPSDIPRECIEPTTVNRIKMGSAYTSYKIMWFNSTNNNTYLGFTRAISDISGRITLDPIAPLTCSRPIIGFKISRSNASFVLPQSSDNSFQEMESNFNLLHDAITKKKNNTSTSKTTLDRNNHVIISPNPSSNVFSISMSVELSLSIRKYRIIDFAGKIIIEDNWDNKKSI